MSIEAPGVTDVTDVTFFPYPPHTCTRAYVASLGIRVTSVSSVTAILRIYGQ